MFKPRFPMVPGTLGPQGVARGQGVAIAPVPGTDPRINGAPTAPPGTRLPGIPVAPYDAPIPDFVPIPQDSPVLGLAETYESQRFTLQTFAQPTGTLYTTRQRWRAIDVYGQVSGSALPTNGVLTIFIWAVSQAGIRTLVSSGRWVFGLTSQPPPPQKWIAAARSVTERWEVSYAYSQTGAALAQSDLQVVIVAADEAVNPPSGLGSIMNQATPTADGGVTTIFSNGAPGTQIPPNIELLSFQATNLNAGVRYAQVFDKLASTPGGPPTLGDIPLMSFGIPAGVGQSINPQNINYRGQVGLLIATSSTAATFTNALGDAVYSVQWR